jgi:hypothetical protein
MPCIPPCGMVWFGGPAAGMPWFGIPDNNAKKKKKK